MTIRLTFDNLNAANAFYSAAMAVSDELGEQLDRQLPVGNADDHDKLPVTMLIDDRFKELIGQVCRAAFYNAAGDDVRCDANGLVIDHDWVQPSHLTDIEKDAIAALIAAVELSGREKRVRKLWMAVQIAYRLLEG